MYETLSFDCDARGIATLTLNRPDKHNAMSGQMIAELSRVAGQIAGDDSIRAVILAGNGKSFCAGGDLNWMREQISASRNQRITEARKLAMALQALNQLPKPLIGRIHGNAFGGGIGLACICDITIASTNARFGLTETKLGLMPATIGPYVLSRMGAGAARSVFMSSRPFDGQMAKTLGIVHVLVEPDALDARVAAEAEAYLSCAPGAVAASKSLAMALGGEISQQTIDATITKLADRWESEEAQDGISAFFDKSPAPWA